jgi:pimeloyl-ACP methyl ester carboxylesterase/aryl carrier-like protein
VVLEAAPPIETRAAVNGPLVFPLSAPNPRRLAQYAHALAQRLDSDVDLQSVAYVLQTGREEKRARFVVVGNDRTRIIAALREVEAGACRGESDALAEAWVRGETVDWSSRWTQRPRRVSLPTFPLERTRHWFRVDAPLALPNDSDLATTIRTQLAEILGIAASEIAADHSFSKLGLDSIFAMDLAERLTALLGTEVRAAELYDHDTIDALTVFLDRRKPGDALREILTTVLGRSFDPQRRFVDNGFTSLDMLRAVSELERSLGSLRKTLLFDQPDLAALTAHLCATYGTDAVRQLEIRDDAPVATDAPAEATIIAKRQIQAGSRLANVIHELAQRHGLESGLAGRDIAPLLFVDENERGYLEFSRRRDMLLVWSYTGSSDDFDRVVEAFVAYARSQNLRVNLLSPIRIEEIGGSAFMATPFGVVQQIEDLGEFSLDAPKMGRLRGVVNRFARSGDCRVTEYVTGSDAAIDEQLMNLVDRWAEGKSVVNPYAWTIREDLRHGRLAPEHRVFLTSVDNMICAAVIVTRMQSEAGYLLDAEFYGPDMPMGGLESTIVRIIDVLRAEGIRIFSFGATFGVKMCDSPNASPEAERGLDELRSVGVVSSGNYQFKNKFRPGELPIYLCQPVDRVTDVADVLLMIGSPEPESTKRNPTFDLLTDSWAEREDSWIGERMRALTEQQTNMPDAIEQPWLPFALAIPTPSGRAAEGLLCRAWPGRRGVVLHNGLFPTWTFNLGDQRFAPMELDEEQLDAALARERVSFIVIELSNNARGGHPTSLASLRKIRAAASSHGVPLVLDATRVLENAVFLAEEEGRDPWSIVRELFALADAATLSLSKDWGVNFGGLVVSNLPELNDRLREEAALRGTDVGLSSRRLLQTALSDRDKALRNVRERMAAVRALWQRLSDAGLPVVAPAGGHCVLLDVARMPAFAGLDELLSWIDERTGIRGGRHVAGDNICRLAVPIGMPVETADRIGASLATLFDKPEWFTQQLRELGTTLTGNEYSPANENLEVLRELAPDVECRMVTIPEGEVEVFTVGAGPVLLLMQPFNIGAGMFAPQLAALSDRFRIVVIHQPGVGRTRATGSLSLDGVARLQRNALTALGVNQPIHVGGASVGAIFAQHFALTYPELTLSLSLIGGSYRFANRKGQIDKLEQVVNEDFDMIVKGSGSMRIAEERERLTKLLLRCESMDPQTGLRYLDLFVKEPELTPRLGQIQAPTLILQGRHDSVVGVKTGHLLHGAIPNARYVELPASGHFVCFTDADIVNRTMAEFLEEVMPAAVYSQV